MDGLLEELDRLQRTWEYLRSPLPTREPTVQFTEEEKKRINALMKKHGLLDGRTAVHNESGKESYYFQGDQRIRFK